MPARAARRRVVASVLMVLVALVPALAGCGSTPHTTSSDAPARARTPPPDSEAADQPEGQVEVPERLRFSGTTLAGGRFKASTLAGKPVALWFWAPWCPICRAEAPTVARLSKTYAGTVSFVGIAGLDKRQAMRGFVADTGVGGMPHLADEEGSLWRRFSVTTQATFVMLDANGEVAYKGRLDADELTTFVRRLAA